MVTIKKLKENCDTISEQIKQIGANNNGCFVIDGIIDPEKYLNAKCRILWILKEPNTEHYSWSFLEKFKNKDWLYKYGKRVPMLRRIIYTSYGILRDCQWSEIPDAKNEKSFEPLQEIALINIKKTPGGRFSRPSEIIKAFNENKKLLKLQINTYNPNIIIFGNTLRFFETADFKDLKVAEKKCTQYGNVYYDTGNKLFINTWHPSIIRTDKDYVMDIVAIATDWLKKK